MPKYRITEFNAGQVNNLGPLTVKDSHLRLALNTDLTKRTGSIMRRDGYTQLGAALSSSSVSGMHSINSLLSPTLNYPADAIPASSSPVWTKTAAGSPTESAASGILTTTGTGTSTQYYTKADSTLSNSVGTTVEWKLQLGTASTSHSDVFVRLDDGTKKLGVLFIAGEIQFDNNVTPAPTYSMTTTDVPHVYRLTFRGSNAYFYADGVLVKTITVTNSPSTSAGLVFGDENSFTDAGPHTEYWHYLKYWNYGELAPGEETLLAASGSNIYRRDATQWTSLSQALTTGFFDMVEFNKKLFVSNGNDALRVTSGGSSFVTTGDADNAPIFKYMEKFFDRIYGAYADDDPDKVWYSSVPMDLVTHVNGAVSATTTGINVASSKYIKVGDVIDIYTHGTSTKVEDSITITGVPSETRVTFASTAIAVADNDDIYIEDTKGTLGLKWDASGTPNADYMRFPGQVITGLKAYGDYLIVACKNSMQVIDKYQTVTEIASTLGCPSGRSMAVVNEALYWFNQKGIVRWTGQGQPQIISHDIKDFTDAVSTSFLASTVAWADGNSYCVYVDDLTVGDRTHQNVIIEYDTEMSTWQIHSIGDVITCATEYAPAPGTTKYVYLGTSDGEIHRWRNGTSDDGAVITLDVETVDHYIGPPETTKHIDKIWVLAQVPGSATIEISCDGRAWKHLGDIQDKITRITCSHSGNYFRFRIRHTETNSPQIDAIIVNYTEQGDK